MDFMHDSLYGGRSFRTLNIIDEGVREALAIEVDTSLPAARVVRVLEQLNEWRGLPDQIRVDNGPELIAQELQNWCDAHHITLAHIQPGKPNQNAFIERFNRTYRHEVLNAHLFESLDDVREISWQWLHHYNEERPHDALNGLPPSHYRRKLKPENSTN
jgi:putative transposase